MAKGLISASSCSTTFTNLASGSSWSTSMLISTAKGLPESEFTLIMSRTKVKLSAAGKLSTIAGPNGGAGFAWPDRVGQNNSRAVCENNYDNFEVHM